MTDDELAKLKEEHDQIKEAIVLLKAVMELQSQRIDNLEIKVFHNETIRT